MTKAIRWAAAGAASLLVLSQAAFALEKAHAIIGDQARPVGEERPKAASTQTLGSRGTVTSSATLFGGFEIAQQATVYIMVRGNSLQTLGVTNNFLDAPRVRIFNAAGQDMIVDDFGRAGFNACLPTGDFYAPVYNYYTNVRRQAPHERDGCFAGVFQAGVYTFTVTPSIPGVTTTSGTSNPSSGQVLFEITLGPSS